jgi:hypothetical protein
MAEAVSFHQIYYKEEQLPHLYPWAKPYFNPGLTIFFENDPIAKIVSETESEKVGVCSWKLSQKLRQRLRLTVPLEEAIFKMDYQVLALTRQSSHHQMMAAAKEWHPGFIETITMIWTKLGLRMPGETKSPIYQNHFIAKTSIYKRYVDEFLKPAMDLVMQDEELNKLMTQDSHYGKLSQGDVRSVKDKLGMDFYPMAPFVLERCPALWMTMHKIPVTYI